jgi:uncharacterized RDD family membrane protein YckC
VAVIIDGIIVGVPANILGLIIGANGIFFSYGLITVLGIVYYLFLEGGPSGQTVGKMVMKIRVVRAEDGGPLGWGGAGMRYITKIVSGIICYVGWLWMLWDPEKLTLHDKWSKTLVVPATLYPPPVGSFGKPPAS